MFKRVLIANRGEIACRIMRTCRRLGIETVAICSEADRDALHVRTADLSESVGPANLTESYLSISSIIAAAKRAGAEAIHPGYGLLSERADFAQAIIDAGLDFVGPPPEVIRAMAGKTGARAIMRSAGVPLAAGTADAVEPDDDLDAIGSAIGFPLMVKASDGGGGIGMTIVRDPAKLADAFARARRSAGRAFGSNAVFLERFVENARHIEVQLLGDAHGTLLAFGDRDCSIQRRHQKVVEEALAPALDDELRARLASIAVLAGQAVGYRNAGTVEFLVSPSREIFFLEMNTRLQVEHPVTEEVFGHDLVELQLRVAAGEALTLRQDQIVPRNHAIECRIYAEDPETQLPSPGAIQRWEMPQGPGIRIDTGMEDGGIVSPMFDPLLAKLIVSGHDRKEAVARLEKALAVCKIGGVRTNVELLLKIVGSVEFREGRYDTGLIEKLRSR